MHYVLVLTITWSILLKHSHCNANQWTKYTTMHDTHAQFIYNIMLAYKYTSKPAIFYLQKKNKKRNRWQRWRTCVRVSVSVCWKSSIHICKDSSFTISSSLLYSISLSLSISRNYIFVCVCVFVCMYFLAFLFTNLNIAHITGLS